MVEHSYTIIAGRASRGHVYPSASPSGHVHETVGILYIWILVKYCGNAFPPWKSGASPLHPCHRAPVLLWSSPGEVAGSIRNSI